MRSPLPLGFAVLFCALIILAGCQTVEKQPLPPAPMRLSRVGFSALPGWSSGDPAAALAAFRRSCSRILSTDPGKSMAGAGYAGTVADWQPACRAVPPSDTGARAFFETSFLPFAVSGGAVPEGLFTGYYEPEISASRTRHDKFQTPVYGLPRDLISVDLGEFRPALKGERIAGRVEGGRLVPYATRADIEAEGLPQAQPLFFAADPVALFFLQIQGSGRVRFDDGSVARVAYAGQNGHPYTAIGRTLIAQGALTQDKVSLQSIRDWLKANPDQAADVMNTNASYVFFRELPVGDPALGATGSEGVSLTPQASLAVDLRLHPLGVPFFLASTYPETGDPLDILMIAQDTGGAIRGAVRGDIFWGTGAQAENLAGKMKQTGKLFVLLPANLAAKLGDDFAYSVP